jgi:hypothetical protein
VAMHIRCLNCQMVSQVPDDSQGKKALCAKCGLLMQIPVLPAIQRAQRQSAPKLPQTKGNTPNAANEAVTLRTSPPRSPKFPRSVQADNELTEERSSSKMSWIIAAASGGSVLCIGLIVALVMGTWKSNPEVQPVAQSPARKAADAVSPKQDPKQTKEEVKPVPVPPRDPVPIAPKKPADPLTIGPQPANWDVKGNIREDRDTLVLDNNGGEYSVISKKPLPRNFKLVIHCQVEFLKGRQVILRSQDGIWQLLCVRFATPDATAAILERRGNLLQFSDTQMLLWKNAAVLKNERRGNASFRMVLTITKQDGDYAVAVNDEIWLRYHDDQPLSAEESFSIGGYLSRLRLGEVTVIDLGPDKR